MDVYTHELDKLEKIILQELKTLQHESMLLNESRRFSGLFDGLSRYLRAVLRQRFFREFIGSSILRLSNKKYLDQLVKIAKQYGYENAEKLLMDLQEKELSRLTTGPALAEANKKVMTNIAKFIGSWQNTKQVMEVAFRNQGADDILAYRNLKQDVFGGLSDFFRRTGDMYGTLRRARTSINFAPDAQSMGREKALDVLIEMADQNSSYLRESGLDLALRFFGELDDAGRFISNPTQEARSLDFFLKKAGMTETAEEVSKGFLGKGLNAQNRRRINNLQNFAKKLMGTAGREAAEATAAAATAQAVKQTEPARSQILKNIGRFLLYVGSPGTVYGFQYYISSDDTRYKPGDNVEEVQKRREDIDNLIKAFAMEEEIEKLRDAGKPVDLMTRIQGFIGRIAIGGFQLGRSKEALPIIGTTEKQLAKEGEIQQFVISPDFLPMLRDMAYVDFVNQLATGRELNEKSLNTDIGKYASAIYGMARSLPSGMSPEQLIQEAKRAMLESTERAYNDFDEKTYVRAVIQYQHNYVDSLAKLKKGKGALAKTIKDIMGDGRRGGDADTDLKKNPARRAKLRKSLQSSAVVALLVRNLPKSRADKLDFQKFFNATGNPDEEQHLLEDEIRYVITDMNRSIGLELGFDIFDMIKLNLISLDRLRGGPVGILELLHTQDPEFKGKNKDSTRRARNIRAREIIRARSSQTEQMELKKDLRESLRQMYGTDAEKIMNIVEVVQRGSFLKRYEEIVKDNKNKTTPEGIEARKNAEKEIRKLKTAKSKYITDSLSEIFSNPTKITAADVGKILTPNMIRAYKTERNTIRDSQKRKISYAWDSAAASGRR